MGWRRVAEQELPHARAPDTRQYLEAYADGVNAYLDQTDSPGPDGARVRRARAGRSRLPPEPWTPVDSLAWLKAMAWDLRGNMRRRDRPRARAGRVDQPRAGATSSTRRTPTTRTRRSSTTRAVVTGVFDAARAPRPAPATPHLPPVPAGRRAALAAASARRWPPCPALLGRGDGIGSQLLGGRRRPLQPPASRCWPTTRTSATSMPGHLEPDGAALHARSPRLPARRLRLHLLRAARRRHRPQRSRSPGASPTSARTSATSTSSGSGATVPATTAS